MKRKLDKLTQKEIGLRIREVRKSLKKNQTEFAREVEINQAALSKYELGQREIPAVLLIDIAMTFNISLNWLLLGEEHPFEEAHDLKIEQLMIEVLRRVEMGEADLTDLMEKDLSNDPMNIKLLGIIKKGKELLAELTPDVKAEAAHMGIPENYMAKWCDPARLDKNMPLALVPLHSKADSIIKALLSENTG